MNSRRDAEFRLKLAEGFLTEAEQDIELVRWRSCVDNAQRTAENAAKAVLAMRGPVPKVHKLKGALVKLVEDPALQRLKEDISVLGEIAEKLGFEEHIRTGYGDESQYLTPWDIFNQEAAEEAASLARRAYDTARRIIEKWPRRKKR